MFKKKKEEIPQYINSPLNNPMKNYAVYIMDKGESFLVHLITFILGGLVGLIFYGGLFKSDGYATLATYISNAVVFVVLGFFGMRFLTPMYVERKKNEQKNKIKTQFRDMLESLATSFSTGSNATKAVESALADLKLQYSDDADIVREMQEVVDGMNQNISLEVMMRNFGDRSGNEDIQSFADVFEVCYRKGGNMSSVIHRTHDVINEKIAVSDEIETKLTSNKMQHNVMSVMPIAVVAMLRVTNESFATNFATPMGVIVNTAAIIVFVAAYKYGQKIVDIKG